MSSVLTVARAEARRIFVSPLAWTVLAALQFVFGYVLWISLSGFAHDAMLGGDDSVGVTDYIIAGTLVSFPWVLMLLVMPLMTMRLFADERKSGTITLLFSSPISLTELVLGKFLGVLSFVLAVIALLALMAFSLEPGTGYHLDTGRIAAGLLGLFLMLSAFSAAGLFVSSLTKEPVIAAVLSLVLLLMVSLIQVPANIEGVPFPGLWQYLSLISHFESLRRGVFNSADVVYYLLFTALFLWGAVQRLDFERA
jgi:ABC-2 type transport system permease protein